MKFNMILAIGQRGELGLNGGLPWPRLAADMKNFQKLTTGPHRENAVIMGRGTYESIVAAVGRPLPNRFNCVISTTLSGDTHGVAVVDSRNSALELCAGFEETWVIGGQSLYQHYLWHAHLDKVVVTHIDREWGADCFIPPKWLAPEWGCIEEDMSLRTEHMEIVGTEEISYSIRTYRKKQPATKK